MNIHPADIDACDEDLLESMRIALRCAPPVDREGAFPRAWWQHLASRGLLGVGFDADGRAARADWTAIAALAGLIARETASVGLALAWLMNEMLGRFVIGPHARNEAQRALVRMMARGAKIVALAISEPKVGAHPKHLSCFASRHDDHWQLDGEKAFVSNGPAADAVVVLAVTGEAGGRKIFDAFVVDTDATGLNRLPSGRPAALPPLGHCGLAFDACHVARAGRLRTDGRAFDLIARPLRALEDALLAGVVCGAMQAELDALASWQRGAAPTPATLRTLGALQLELAALAQLAAASASHLDKQGADDRLTDLNVGTRRMLERWQGACEAFAAPLDDHSPNLLELGRDIRTVLGIARGVGEARELAAGTGLLHKKEPDEVPA
jgi:acyl-CoA dehydrogenase